MSPSTNPTQMINGHDDPDLIVDDWVLVNHLHAPIEEVVEEEEERDMIARLEEVLTLREDHFQPLAPLEKEEETNNNGGGGLVSLSELCPPQDGYESGLEEEFDEFRNELMWFYISNEINPLQDDPEDDHDDTDDVGAMRPDDQQLYLFLFMLWRAVTELGGYHQVTSNGLWEHVGEVLGLPSCVFGSFAGFYKQTLLQYEKHKLGNSNEDADADDEREEEEEEEVVVPAVDQNQEQNGDASPVPAAGPEESFNAWATRSFML